MGAYCGRVVFVDLTSGSIREERLPEATYRHFIGGAGLGARIIYEHTKSNVDPLGPENVLGFMPGLLSGTGAPMASKWVVVTKSPLTGTWGDANSGGMLGHELKSAGCDAVFFTGIAPKPVYLLVRDDQVELRDATHMWGMDTDETEKVLHRETGERRLGIACIGPAGERLSLIASVIGESRRAAGRSGTGAVMGSKKLKAIAVRGTKKTAIADAGQFRELRNLALKHLREVDRLPFIKSLSTIGTCGGPLGLVPTGAAPLKNWSVNGKEAFPEYPSTAGDSIVKYQVRKTGCGNCPVNCGGILRVKEGPFATEGRKPEYETIGAFGLMCLNSNAESIIKANDICDRYGIDTISAGTTIAFATECYQNGLISKEDTGGIELAWGNAPAIIALLEKIVRREGFGDVLADGVQRAAERIGKGAKDFAVHIRGQEPGLHDPRMFPYRGLSYIANATPGRHMTSSASIRLEGEKRLGSHAELQAPEGENDNERRGKIHAIASSYSQTFVDAGMCLHALSAGTDYPLIEFISAATGWDFSAGEAITAGKRILTLRQSFNVREGLTLKDFRLPNRISAPLAAGPIAGRGFDFDALRETYFKAMGWDPESGVPSRQCLAELGLSELIK